MVNPSAESTNTVVDKSHILINRNDSLKQQYQSIHEAIPSGCKLDAIYCMAGGFEMGSVRKEGNPLDFIDIYQRMVHKNMDSAILAVSVAMKNLASYV